MKAILVLLASLAINAHAAHGMGNGGDAVVCYTDATRTTIKSVQMFDYWEQEQVLKYGDIDLGAPNLTVQEKIVIATNRLAKFDPALAEKINKSALNLANNIQNYVVTNYVLPEIDDANPQVIPTSPNCYIEQYGVQYKNVVTGQKRFYIADKFYNFTSTSNDDRAGLLLHEAIYRTAILAVANLNTSDGVRYFNYIITSNKLNALDLEQTQDYVAILKLAGLYDSNCKKKGFLFVFDSNYAYQELICYNQKVALSNSMSVVIPYPSNVQTRFGPNNRLDVLTIRHITAITADQRFSIINSGNTYRTGKDFEIDLLHKTLDFKIFSAIGNYPVLVNGPLSLSYVCDEGARVNYITNEVLECYTGASVAYSGENYKFGVIRKLNNDTWFVGNKSQSKFNVLGSQTGLKVVLDDTFGGIIDNNLNVISATLEDYNKLNPILNVNGFDYKLQNFNVVLNNGVYSLNFISQVMFFHQPRISSLRVVNTAGAGSGNLFCKLNGYSGGSSETELNYIDGKSEQFFDLNTSQVIYKIDEDVTVVEKIWCNSVNASTKNY